MEEEEATPLSSHQKTHQRALTTKALNELLAKDAEHIILRLGSKDGGLEQLVKEVHVGNERMCLLLYAVAKSFDVNACQSLYQNIVDIIDTMLKSNFLERTLYVYIESLGKENEEKMISVILGTLVLVRWAMETSPAFAEPKVRYFKALLQGQMSNLKSTSEKIQKEFDAFNRLLEQHRKKQNHTGEGQRMKEERVQGTRVRSDDEQPEETFRELPLIPTQEDLISDQELFVRRNREKGRYPNLEEYLDVQFRLFRADFILPLRESIEKYIGSHDNQDIKVGGRGVRVYNGVQIIRPVCTDRDIAYRLAFDISHLPSVDWRTTQRLKFGSLLCLSCDNFQNFICAVVHERQADLLKNGFVDVVFILNPDELHGVIDVSRDQRFVMVESPAYFEAYRHVLQGLKNLNDQNFPFSRYIVQCDSRVHPPRYLQQDRVIKYDFRPLTDEAFHTSNNVIDANADPDDGVNILNDREWPRSSDLGLDDSQYLALRHVLTQEFALVQGPPGTGKTYLGMKIVRMLLHNSQSWNVPKRPMLVVCYTNHALDQFLEGILAFVSGQLVRVGSRSCSEKLKEHMLSNFRMRARENRKVPMEVHEAKMRARNELRELRVDIHGGAAAIEIAEQGIVKESFLEAYMNDRHRGDFASGSEGMAMLTWLGVDHLLERITHQAEYNLNRLPPWSKIKGGSKFTSPEMRFEEETAEDDEEDEETVDVEQAFRDSSALQRLDDEDEDEFDLGFEMNLDAEETNEEKIRRRLKELESETFSMRRENLVLDVTTFCDGDTQNIRDRTKSKSTKQDDKEAVKRFTQLRQRQKSKIQSLLRDVDRMSELDSKNVPSVWKLKWKDRWRLYRYWVDIFCRQKRGEIKLLEEQYHVKALKYKEALDQEDRAILQNATVIGMTTTGAAQYQAILHAIGPPIVVVEEAAEVFEAHVVATLSRDCQHLILIGDHKQLRPSPVVFQLAKRCNLDVSLFERMIQNEFHFDCLEFQHRMRPEISRMMRLPDLYPKLQDHEVVKKYEPIRGLKNSVYYITHSRPEERDDETKSYSNDFEANYLVALCSYLLKQGYQHHQITILCPYSGQIRLISSRMPKRQFEGVRVVSVDNFQGEESDILLLSLVRSNSDNSIGFLKFNNRICVALSRAKMGMYIIGNFELLRKESTLIEQIVQAAKAQGILGDSLQLTCPKHPREGIIARSAEDFDRAPEGGCALQCDVRLPCGHKCLRKCHPANDHDGQHCHQSCVKECPDCKQRCQVGHFCSDHKECKNLVKKRIARCDHEQYVPCGTDPMIVECQEPCTTMLPCGHQCQNKCGQAHTRLCGAKVTMDNAPCGHTFQAPCSQRANAHCTQPCSQKLVCDHKCGGTCGDCSGGRLHMPCQQKCLKILVCGHNCGDTCCHCPPCKKMCENRCAHSHCDKECGQLCVQCTMKCDWRCKHSTCTKLCYEPCDRQRCSEPCTKLSPSGCGHYCIGLCGENCPPFCRICDEEILNESISGEPGPDDRFVLLEDCCHVIEVSFLDRWVDEFSRKSEENPDRLVKLPECPKCKAPIRRNLRYGNVIKQSLMEIEQVKRRCIGDERRMGDLLRMVEMAQSQLPPELKQQIQIHRTNVCESQLAAQFYQITLLKDTNQLLRQVQNAKIKWPEKVERYKDLEIDLKCLMAWTSRERRVFSDQEEFDSKQEFQRLRLLVRLLYCIHTINTNGIEVEVRILRRLAATIRVLGTGKPVAENDFQEGNQLSEELKKAVPDTVLELSDKERLEIVRAVNLPSGHWYACSRGHYYVIGECGRPTEMSKCPECHNPIGGAAHELEPGNRWAPEVDDAEGPVWSEERDAEYARLLQQLEFENWH